MTGPRLRQATCVVVEHAVICERPSGQFLFYSFFAQGWQGYDYDFGVYEESVLYGGAPATRMQRICAQTVGIDGAFTVFLLN